MEVRDSLEAGLGLRREQRVHMMGPIATKSGA